jgi:hypothetical protein
VVAVAEELLMEDRGVSPRSAGAEVGGRCGRRSSRGGGRTARKGVETLRAVWILARESVISEF